MNEHFFDLLIMASGLVSGLIGTYVGLQNRALLAEVRKELAETENRICDRINGKYVRSSECHLREAAIREHIDMLADEFHRENAAGD
jgi:hypothetical protein